VTVRWLGCAALVIAVLIGVGSNAISLAAGASRVGPPSTGRVAYDRGDRLVLVNLDGTDRRTLRTPKQPRGWLVWSRDGSAIALVRHEGRFHARRSFVYIMRPAGGTVTRVAHLPGNVDTLLWSPDGKKIAFSWTAPGWCTNGKTRTAAIYLAGTHGGGIRRLVSVEPNPPSRTVSPIFELLDWSPDGRRLLYNNDGWRTGGGCGEVLSGDWLTSALLHIGIAGGRPTTVPPNEASQGEWSPNGRLLALCGQDVTVARQGGRVVRRWFNHYPPGQGCFGEWPKMLTWSPSGDEVYTARSDRIAALRVRDGWQRTVFNFDAIANCSGDFSCSLKIEARSRDGRFLIVGAEGGERDVNARFLVSTDGARHHRLPDRIRGPIVLP
jgi:WD40 repeat protein